MLRVFNHFGMRFRHSVIALDQDFAAAENVDEDVDLQILARVKSRSSIATALIDCAMALRRLRPDLLFTYNWGSIEWAMANRLLGGTPHIHFEAGFGKNEADRQLRRRVLFRRVALTRCDKLIVPSSGLEKLARQVWRIPGERIALIPNGVDTNHFANLKRDAIPGFSRRPGELVVGTLAPLRPEKNIGRLLRIFAALERSLAVRLVIAGDGSERQMLTQLAAELGIADRVLFTGRVAPAAVLGNFDIFAISSDTEQMPNALLEAMAAGLPVVAVDVGDIKYMLGQASHQFIVSRDDGAAFLSALKALIGDPGRRAELGRVNRQRAVDLFSQERMFTAYSLIFDQILAGRSDNDNAIGASLHLRAGM